MYKYVNNHLPTGLEYCGYSFDFIFVKQYIKSNVNFSTREYEQYDKTIIYLHKLTIESKLNPHR